MGRRFGFALLVCLPLLFVSGIALAEESGQEQSFVMKEMLGFAVAIGMGLGALGGALGQSKAAAAALEGITRNPGSTSQVFVPMVLCLSFIESIVLFTFALMFLLLQKL